MRKDFPEHRIGKRIKSILSPTSELFQAALQLCDPNGYNLVLHKHLGDVFYAIAAKDVFEREHGRSLRLIVRPQHEFILNMYDVSNYRILDLDIYVLANVNVQRALLDKAEPTAIERDSVENWLFQAVFACIPIVGIPFVCENNIHAFFDNQLTSGLLSYRLYWAYRWAGNMGLDENFKFPCPSQHPLLSRNGNIKLGRNMDFSKTVILAPDATTASELEPDFWKILARILKSQGYSVIINSKKVLIEGVPSTFELGLSLPDVVSLCFKSAYVFALRSGLCDVLASMGSRLYVFYTAMLNREMHGLNYVFERISSVNEIEIRNWKISPIYWRDLNLADSLQKDIDRLRSAYRKVSIKRRLGKGDPLTLDYAKMYYERIAVGPSYIVDNNAQKFEYMKSNRARVKVK